MESMDTCTDTTKELSQGTVGGKSSGREEKTRRARKMWLDNIVCWRPPHLNSGQDSLEKGGGWSMRLGTPMTVLVNGLMMMRTRKALRSSHGVLTLSYFRTYIYVRSPKTVATPVRIYTYTDFAIEIWGFYRRLTDTLRYHHTRCSCDFGLQLAAILKHVYQRKKSWV